MPNVTNVNAYVAAEINRFYFGYIGRNSFSQIKD